MRLINRFFRLFRIDYEKLHNSKTEGLFWMDILMIVLVAFNLSWIVFEYAFTYDLFQQTLSRFLPRFYEWYAGIIHPNFLIYDSIFVAVFVIELTVRWIVAVRRKTYEKWYFYPFVHWYDVLGCIPLSAFRALRLLRLFSMVYRLQRLGIIDLTSTVIYKRVNWLLTILTEEVSDRVVINVLSGVQDELGKGSPIAEKIIRQVILPRQHFIATWIARQTGEIGWKTFSKNEALIRRIIDRSVSESIRSNKEIARLKLIPGAGGLITNILNESVTDITFNAIKLAIEDFSNPENNAGIINDASYYTLHAMIREDEASDQSLDELVAEISVEVLDIIKEEVSVRQWQQAEEERKQLKQSPEAAS